MPDASTPDTTGTARANGIDLCYDTFDDSRQDEHGPYVSAALE